MSLNKYFNFTQPRPNQTFPRRTYFAMHPNDIWQVDLVDLTAKGKVGGVGSQGGVYKEEATNMQRGKGSGGYILNAIDVYSRKNASILLDKENKKVIDEEKSTPTKKVYKWVLADSKTGVAIMKGLKKLFVQMGGKPKKIQSDKESGIISKDSQDEFKKIGIETYYVANSYDNRYSAPIVERLNRTMNDYMYKVEVDKPNESNRAISEFVANNFPNKYNNDKHRTIQTTPNNAFNGTTSTNDVLGAVFNYAEHKPQAKRRINMDLKVGDLVYVPTPVPARGNIEAKGIDKWYREPHKITKIFNTNPPTLELEGFKHHYYYE